MTNWNLLLNTNSDTVKSFAVGQLSVRKAAQKLAFTPAAGEFRRLVRSRGTTEARLLARKALGRRSS